MLLLVLLVVSLALGEVIKLRGKNTNTAHDGLINVVINTFVRYMFFCELHIIIMIIIIKHFNLTQISSILNVV